jgi:hypothetical protein
MGMSRYARDVAAGLLLAAAIVLVILCASFDSTFVYRGF